MKTLTTCLILIFGVLSLAACDNSSSSPQSIANCPTGLTPAAASQVSSPASATPGATQPCSFQALSERIAAAQASGQIPNGISVTPPPLNGSGTSPTLGQTPTAGSTPSLGIASMNKAIRAQSAAVGEMLKNLQAQSVDDSGPIAPSTDRSPASAGSAAPIAVSTGGGGSSAGGETPGGATR